MPGFWFPRPYNLSQCTAATLPNAVKNAKVNVTSILSGRSWDPVRLGYSMQMSSSAVKPRLAVDIRPSTLPNCSVEILKAVQTSNAPDWRAAWSADLWSNPQSGVAHRRSLVQEPSGSGAGIVPLGAAPFTGV